MLHLDSALEVFQFSRLWLRSIVASCQQFGATDFYIYIHYIYVNNSHKSASQSPLPAIDLFRLLGPHKNRNLEFSPLKDSSKSRLSSSSQKSRMHFYCHCCCSDWYIVYIVFAALLCIVICIFFAPLPFGQRRVVCETWSEYKIVEGELWQLYDYLLSDLDWEAAAIELEKREKAAQVDCLPWLNTLYCAVKRRIQLETVLKVRRHYKQTLRSYDHFTTYNI